jgi:transposase
MRIINTIISSGYPGSNKGRHYETHCAGLIKLIWHDGVGLCMLTKRLEQGQFIWPSADTTGRITLCSAQLAALLDGCEWRAPARARRPELAG